MYSIHYHIHYRHQRVINNHGDIKKLVDWEPLTEEIIHQRVINSREGIKKFVGWLIDFLKPVKSIYSYNNEVGQRLGHVIDQIKHFTCLRGNIKNLSEEPLDTFSNVSVYVQTLSTAAVTGTFFAIILPILLQNYFSKLKRLLIIFLRNLNSIQVIILSNILISMSLGILNYMPNTLNNTINNIVHSVKVTNSILNHMPSILNYTSNDIQDTIRIVLNTLNSILKVIK